MLFLIYAVFILLIVILAIIVIYFWLAIRLKKRNEKAINIKSEKIEHIFDTLLNEDIKVVDDELKELQQCFLTENGFKAFHNAYQNYSKDRNLNKEFKYLMNNIVDYTSIYHNKSINETYRKSYVLYLISEFNLDNEKTRKLALDSLLDKSFYVRINALSVIRNQKNESLVIDALNAINKFTKYFNKRVVIDFLDNFQGNQELLDQSLVEKVDEFNEALRSVVLDHFINESKDNQKVKDKLLDYLTNSTDPETVLKCTRYFGIDEDPRAKATIFANMNHPDWGVRAISAVSLEKYADRDVINALKTALSDRNYFVRKNTAFTLLRILEKEELFYEALHHEDDFARDILVYTIQNSSLEGFEEYSNIENLEEEKHNLELKLEKSGL